MTRAPKRAGGTLPRIETTMAESGAVCCLVVRGQGRRTRGRGFCRASVTPDSIAAQDPHPARRKARGGYMAVPSATAQTAAQPIRRQAVAGRGGGRFERRSWLRVCAWLLSPIQCAGPARGPSQGKAAGAEADRDDPTAAPIPAGEAPPQASAAHHLGRPPARTQQPWPGPGRRRAAGGDARRR